MTLVVCGGGATCLVNDEIWNAMNENEILKENEILSDIWRKRNVCPKTDDSLMMSVPSNYLYLHAEYL